MIIVQTPFRVSFAGGGTDLRDFYGKEQGAVLSTTIKKYMYIATHRYFEDKFLLKYSKTELVDDVNAIQHPLIRHCFLKTAITQPLEVTSFADVPSSGTGLGSSSAFTVGLLKALYAAQQRNIDNHSLAHQACEIEIEELKEPIGKQDQYACAVGGLNLIKFNPDESVLVEPIIIPKTTRQEFKDNLLLLYTGITRSARTVLSDQKKEMVKEDKWKNLCKMRDFAFDIADALKNRDLNAVGERLHASWLLKKSLSSMISNDVIDAHYNKALEHGAQGGKLLGAGGGGFLLLYCEKDKQEKVKKALNLKQAEFEFEPQGSRIVYLSDEDEQN